ncbi:IS630 transposase-related protein, partial [Patescibacteria group bacterium]|nr:IS630 transposase-related protein [Patescibacteria group bacterium]
LKKINPQAARTAVLEYLSSNRGNITKTAKTFGIQRLTIYNILEKNRQGDLQDRSKAPRRVANKTSSDIEQKIIQGATKTGYGAKKLQKFLYDKYNITIPYGTLRGIIRRHLKSLGK